MVGAVARQATHVFSVMRPATPCVTLLIAGVALKTRFVGLRRRQPGRIDDVLGLKAFNVLCAVAMAALAACGARIRQEFGAFAVNVQGEGLHNLLMALLALSSDNGRPLRLPGADFVWAVVGTAGHTETRTRQAKAATINRAIALLENGRGRVLSNWGNMRTPPNYRDCSFNSWGFQPTPIVGWDSNWLEE